MGGGKLTRDQETGPQPDNADSTPAKTARNKGGRPRGSRNKRSILIEQMGADLQNGSVREIVFGVFDLMGGLKGLLDWAEKNPDKFYRDLFLKMGPRASRAAPGPSGPGRPMTEGQRDAPTTPEGVEIEDFTDGA